MPARFENEPVQRSDASVRPLESSDVEVEQLGRAAADRSEDSTLPQQRKGSKMLTGITVLAAITLVVSFLVIGGVFSRDDPDDAKWKSKLTEMQYYVTRKKGTETAFTGKYWDLKDEGIYRCVCCGEPLFSSETKYDSGSGWPSFWQPVDQGAVAEKNDISILGIRTEITCSNCDAHLGHVFSDGPQPTGMRYCMNSAALDFEPTNQSQDDRKGGQ